MKYLLDANTFIEAKNRYYNMTVCPAYWLWILQKFIAQDVASISMVGDELRKGDDELAAWAKDAMATTARVRRKGFMGGKRKRRQFPGGALEGKSENSN